MLGTCETWDRSRDAVDRERRQKVMCAGSGVTNHESPKRGVQVRSDGVTGGTWYPIPGNLQSRSLHHPPTAKNADIS
ncbi:hypothetical protein Pmani_030334 [Petrolisthes manimaculis]|uniref:Uncharacterized protein n=1 Tax=Petrolisthes manimaculis TaxID=1843537 RepID=A0AAE1NVS2_9EUCA|nr:hypothetical protein Pmani_030334 [Petrolisthes manimaculis]